MGNNKPTSFSGLSSSIFVFSKKIKFFSKN
jgi:hypothetical protein